MSLRYFQVTSGALIPNIMHDFLEGLVPLEMKLMLKVKKVINIFILVYFSVDGWFSLHMPFHLQVFVDDKLITLSDIDDHLKSINLRLCDGDKPTLAGISLQSTNANMKQHGNIYSVYMNIHRTWYLHFPLMCIGLLPSEDTSHWVSY